MDPEQGSHRKSFFMESAISFLPFGSAVDRIEFEAYVNVIQRVKGNALE
jgi:hypothetical protein